ncbi:MAG: hypothetical protein DRH24_01810 [Deltaproteobacteria bacterium]|nr:MAG: hypothetical protein DRH24_01810 [Deltaproteobacteria bacterium]
MNHLIVKKALTKTPYIIFNSGFFQSVRNRRRVKGQNANIKMAPSLIAKMDARKSNEFNPIGQFWLVPVIAKMDLRTPAPTI